MSAFRSLYSSLNAMHGCKTHSTFIFRFKLFTLATSYFRNRYLSVKDSDFIELITSEIGHWLKNATINRVLVFPPVSSFHRLLIHDTCAQYFIGVCTFSIGEDNRRRTVVCLEATVLRHLNRSVIPMDTGQSQKPAEHEVKVGDGQKRNRKKRVEAKLYVPPSRRGTASSGASEVHQHSSELPSSSNPLQARLNQTEAETILTTKPKDDLLVKPVGLMPSSGRRPYSSRGRGKGRGGVYVPPGKKAQTEQSEVLGNIQLEASEPNAMPVNVKQDELDTCVQEKYSENESSEDAPIPEAQTSQPTNCESATLDQSNGESEESNPEILSSVSADSEGKLTILSESEQQQLSDATIQNKDVLIPDQNSGQPVSDIKLANEDYLSSCDEATGNENLVPMEIESSSLNDQLIPTEETVLPCDDTADIDIDNSASIEEETEETIKKNDTIEFTNENVENVNLNPHHSLTTRIEEREEMVVHGMTIDTSMLQNNVEEINTLTGTNVQQHVSEEVVTKSPEISECQNATSALQSSLTHNQQDSDTVIHPDTSETSCSGSAIVPTAGENGDSDSKPKKIKKIKSKHSNTDKITDAEKTDLSFGSTDVAETKPEKVKKSKKKEKSKKEPISEGTKQELLENTDEILDSLFTSTVMSDHTTKKAKAAEKKQIKVEKVVEKVEEEVDDWESLFDDSSDVLDDKLMNELTTAVGKVKVETPQFDYLNFQPKDPELDGAEYGHLIEISNFPAEFQTSDLLSAFKQYMERGFDIKWVDDTHAIGIFMSAIAAEDALQMKNPFFTVCPISMAASQTKVKAKKCTEFLQPYKPRPETTASAARRLVAGALGLNSKVPKEKREEERQKLKEARDKKKAVRKMKDMSWDGAVGRCAMDEN